jgi:DNA-binding CsgD family transcriptional regulator
VVSMTDRQKSVAHRVLRGLTDVEIAADLGISRQRVKQLVAIIARKLPGHGSSRRRIRDHLLLVAPPTSLAA